MSGPQRIVSLVPSVSEALWWFHAAARVVGVTDWCTAPPHGFPNAVRVRGTKNPDTEAVIGLRPDIVFANAEENRAIDVQRLRDAGVEVHVSGPATVAEALEMLVDVATIVGNAGAGEDLRTRTWRALAGAEARRPSQALITVVPIWRDPWMILGPQTYAADLLRACGFDVIVAPSTEAVSTRYPHAELDDLREVAEVVLLPDEPYAFGEADRDAFAGRGARVRLIDGTALTWYGPRLPYALAEFSGLARRLSGRRATTR